MKEVKKRKSNKKEDNDYTLSDLATRKNEIIEKLRNAEYSEVEDMVFRMGITYSDTENILDFKYIATTPFGYTLAPSLCQNSDINSMLNSLL